MTEDMEKMEQRSDAWMIIAEMGRQREESDKKNDEKYDKLLKTFKQIVFGLIVAWLLSLGGVVYYFGDTEVVYETYDFDTKDGGNANYVGGNSGDVYN